MDLVKKQLIESVFAQGCEIGARMRARLVCNGVGPSGAVAAISANLRWRHAGHRAPLRVRGRCDGLASCKRESWTSQRERPDACGHESRWSTGLSTFTIPQKANREIPLLNVSFLLQFS
jgi:hypothetical protein